MHNILLKMAIITIFKSDLHIQCIYMNLRGDSKSKITFKTEFQMDEPYP